MQHFPRSASVPLAFHNADHFHSVLKTEEMHQARELLSLHPARLSHRVQPDPNCDDAIGVMWSGLPSMLSGAIGRHTNEGLNNGTARGGAEQASI
ncbi:hypothetical protein SAY87_028979 [Trapa incisa]|uniref:Uncharacterized protein n=1 Tax=Trapa incisa TaxID=236973 RepID=A0AAN7QSJ5_9MYRT|nr:hypothetical protein SAY87_028979 [Trapa incisa]